MTDRELMHQALNALEVMRPACFAKTTLKAADTAITALRDRLAQPEQELVIDCPRCGHCCPQQTWAGLTDEEIGIPTEPIQPHEAIMFARVIEALIKGKNT